MKIILQASVVFFLIASTLSTNQSYTREMVQKIYPGFGTEYLIFLDENNNEVRGYLSNTGLKKRDLNIWSISSYFIKEYITYKLYTRNIPDGKNIITLEDLNGDFDNTKETKFITHGFRSSGESDTCITIKNNLLNRSDLNVIIMDWSPISKIDLYHIPMKATRSVGMVYSDFINQLIQNVSVNPKDIHMIGHSLGAHVSGFAGRRTTEQIARITGLDPALPGFELSDWDRLNSLDADFVDIIHTCAGFLGLFDPVGHVDFYPNGGGPPQPGCTILQIFEACSHGRSWELFAHSINSTEPFLASPCQTINNLDRRDCDGDYVPMGFPTPSTTRGIYFLKTTDKDPYVMPLDIVEDNDLKKYNYL